MGASLRQRAPPRAARRSAQYRMAAGEAAVVSPSVTPLELIWNGWRIRYIEGQPAPASGSVFTQILNCGLPDDETYIVHRGARTFALLNAFPYTTGHLMVLPHRHVAELEDLTADEAAEVMAMTQQAIRVLREVSGPHAFNVGINLGGVAGGSLSQHLHQHVVPRWSGDANFITVVAGTKTLPQLLAQTRRLLAEAWA